MKKTLSALLILATGSAGATVTVGNLIAFYDFNGNANDGSGNGADASLNLGAVISADGTGYSSAIGDSALDLGPSTGGTAGTAANAFATVDFSSATASGAMAVSFWQFDLGNGAGANFSSTSFGIVSSSGGGTRGFQAHTPWGNDILYFDHGGACCTGPNRLTDPAIGTTLLDGWHHIVLQVDNGSKEIWVDGALVASQATGAAAIPTFTGDLMMGAEPAGTNNGFGGRIDEFAVWNSVLSPDDITALAGGAGTQSILVPEPSSGILMLLGGLALIRRRR
ncbi:PEP-CTERM sorting domain-containing protein [Akkermansiaceae bacterium]|nr:PEP-CTERM sorting domain-containing protein [Akkermansiaceae bacterium]